MITGKSRYRDAVIAPQPDRTVAIRRRFPTSGKVVLYTWKASDRIDRIAARFLGDPTLWWKIQDENPLVQDVHDIEPGEQIRIPRV